MRIYLFWRYFVLILLYLLTIPTVYAKTINHLSKVNANHFDEAVSSCIDGASSLGAEAKSYCQCFIKEIYTKYSEKQIEKWTVTQRDHNLTPIEDKCLDEMSVRLIQKQEKSDNVILKEAREERELNNKILSCAYDIADAVPSLSMEKQLKPICKCIVLNGPDSREVREFCVNEFDKKAEAEMTSCVNALLEDFTEKYPEISWEGKARPFCECLASTDNLDGASEEENYSNAVKKCTKKHLMQDSL
jgi:hypothetical protein